MIDKIREYIKNPKILYIAITLFISSLSFIRAFICLRYLNFFELGLIGLVQVLIMIISMLQIGIVTGAYKIYAIDIEDKSINNTVVSYIGVLTILGILASLVWGSISKTLDTGILLIGILIGAVSLYVNWLSCMMLAKQDIKSLNMVNLVAGLINFLLLPAILIWKVNGAFLTTAAYPLLFTLIALKKSKYLRPSAFYLTKPQIKKILYYGFVPYLTSTFFYLNMQIERWSIIDLMGVETLGKLSLCLIATSAFMIIPTALSNLYFPASMRLYAERNFVAFKIIIKKYFTMMLLYSIVVSGLMAGLSNFIIPILFPKHSEQIPLLFWLIPSLISTGMINIATTIFNASFRYRSIIWTNVISVFLMITGIAVLYNISNLKLQHFIMLESLVGILTLIVNYLFYAQIKNKLYA